MNNNRYKQKIHGTVSGLRTWVEVKRSAIQKNFEMISGFIDKDVELYAVAKSNAYGHGLVDYVRLVESFGVSGVCVDSVVEGVALREAGVNLPILILGSTIPERIRDAEKNNMEITVANFESLDNLLSFTLKPISLHLKVDTGMHRQGFEPGELPETLEKIKQAGAKLSLVGIYTHFASAKDPGKPNRTDEQLKKFLGAVREIKKRKTNIKLHAAATGAALIFPNTRLDMVRVGIGLFGLWPSNEIKAQLAKKLPIEPALSWRTRVVEIKKLKQGERIGYDLTEELSRDSTVALLPIGYWHGFPRTLSSKGYVLVRGKRSGVLGRISMDMVSIDVTDAQGASVGDLVTIIGRDGNEFVSADELAEVAGTINYEFVTRLNPLMKRVYL